jgi:hypothetical protein
MRFEIRYYLSQHGTGQAFPTLLGQLMDRFHSQHISVRPCFFLEVGWDWVHLVRRPLIGLLYQALDDRMIDGDECRAVGGMRIGRGNRSIPRKPATMPLCPQIAHDLTWARTRAPAVGSPRITAWAMAQPFLRPIFLKVTVSEMWRHVVW